MAVLNVYVDGETGLDSNTGLTSWDNATKTIWAAIIRLVETDPSIVDGITINISGGLAGISYSEVHNLLHSSVAAVYTGDPNPVHPDTGSPLAIASWDSYDITTVQLTTTNPITNYTAGQIVSFVGVTIGAGNDINVGTHSIASIDGTNQLTVTFTHGGGASYSGGTVVVPIVTTTGVPDGTAIAPVIFKQSSEAGRNGQVSLIHDAACVYYAYQALVVYHQIDYGELRDFFILENLVDNSKDDIQLHTTDNGVIQDVKLLAYRGHGILIKRSDNATISRCYVKSDNSSTSSGIKFTHHSSDYSANGTVHHCHVVDAGGTNTFLHFGMYFDGGAGHKFFNNLVENATGPGFGITGVGVVTDCYNNISHSNGKHAFMLEPGAAVTNSENNTWQATGSVVGIPTAFSTTSATYDTNIGLGDEYTLTQWRGTVGTPDLLSFDSLPVSAGVRDSMPRPESDQFRSGANAILTSESVVLDIMKQTTPEAGENTNMGAYNTRYYMPLENAKPSVVQPLYRGDFVFPVKLA